MKKALLIIGIVAVAAMVSLSGVLIAQTINNGLPTAIDLGESGKEETVRFTDILPGSVHKKQYKVSYNGGFGDFVISFEVGENSALLQYLDLRAVIDGKTVYSGSLSGAVESGVVGGLNGNADVELAYIMPLDVGNDAQNAKLDLVVSFSLVR